MSMLQTQPTFDSIDNSLTFDLELGTLRRLGRFLSGWVDRNAPDVVNRAAFIDFPNKEIHVTRITQNSTDTMGIMSFPFNYSEEMGPTKAFEQETEGLLLALPIHKLISVLTWMHSSNQSSVVSMTLAKEGQVSLEGNDNKIQMDSQWVKGSKDSLLDDYQGSPLYGLQRVYETLTSQREDSYADLRTNALFSRRTTIEGDGETPLDEELDMFGAENAVGKIDGNLVYMKDKQIGDGRFSYLEHDEEKGIRERKTEASSSGITLVGYSRMSLFFSPIEQDEFTGRHQICASDGSVPAGFINEVDVLIHTMEACLNDSSTGKLSIMTVSLPGQAEDTFDCLGLKIEDREDPDMVIAVAITIPSAASVGMGPPSVDDILNIVPEVSLENSFFVTVDYSKIRETLAFWDSLQRVDGNDIVTPLKPVYMNIEDGMLRLAMHGQHGTNEAVFEIQDDYYFEVASDIQVPFDPLMKVLNNPQFNYQVQGKPYITFARRNTPDPAEIIVSRNGATAVIAEFV